MTQNTCPLCGKVNPPDEWVCESCGAELPAKRLQQGTAPNGAPNQAAASPTVKVQDTKSPDSCTKGCGGCLTVFILFIVWAFWSDYNQKQEKIREEERRDAPRKQLEANLKSSDSPLVSGVDYIGYDGPDKGYKIHVGQGWAFLNFQERGVKTLGWYSKAASTIEVDADSYDAGNGVGGYAAKVENGVLFVVGSDHVTYAAQMPKLDKWIVYQGSSSGNVTSGGGRSYYRSYRSSSRRRRRH